LVGLIFTGTGAAYSAGSPIGGMIRVRAVRGGS